MQGREISADLWGGQLFGICRLMFEATVKFESQRGGGALPPLIRYHGIFHHFHAEKLAGNDAAAACFRVWRT